MSLSQKNGTKTDLNHKLQDKKHSLDIPAIQFQFLDRKVSSLTQNYFLKRGITQKQDITPKVKLSETTIYKLKPNNMLDKFQTEKRQALKTQWQALMKMKQDSGQKSKQQKQPRQQKTLNFSKLTKLKQNQAKQYKNLSRQNIEASSLNQIVQHTDGTLDQFNDEETFTLNEKLVKHYEQIISQKYDNLVPDLKSADLSHQIKIDKSSILLDKKESLNFQNCKTNYEKKYANAQKIRQKSYTQQTRQVINIQLNNDNDVEQEKRKASVKSEKPIYQRKKQPNRQMNSKIKRKTYINMSKTVMVQKIINLRKSFNDKYNNSQPNNKSYKQKSNNRRNQEESQLISVISCQNSLNNRLLHTSNDQQFKKVSFRQIFQHQRHKMQRLKRFISQGKVEYSQKQGHYEYLNMPSTKDQGQFNKNIKKIQFDCDSYEQDLILDDFSNLDQDRPLIPIHQIQKDNQKEKIQRTPSQKQKQRFFSISSLEKRYEEQTIQASLTKYTLQPEPNYLRRQPNSHITTYNFDHIRNKKCQNAQVKELRHKYLHANNIQHKSPANKKKFSKQECHKYGISIVSVYDKDEMTLNGERKHFHTEPHSDECEDVQRKNSFNLRKNDYMCAIKARKIGSKSNGKFNTLTQFCKKITNKQGGNMEVVQFEPWQNSDNLPEYESYQDYQLL